MQPVYNQYRNIKHVGLMVKMVDDVCRRLTRRCRSLIDWMRWRVTWRWATRLSSQKCQRRVTRSTRGYRSCVYSRYRHCTSASCGFATSDVSASSRNRRSTCENCVFCRAWSAPPSRTWTHSSFSITSSIFSIRRTMSSRCASCQL